ncbi:D-3-phosphoglycerate dehydrogenase [Bimuria novae-zelandiae CBS 107.79]|uniref:phosphoglycerate dehydrogenase n=1 Tax=Bimuria novae-zelandiae CBS 107.79 TaxID=1447943 RepID=A0A6A5V463_9PLEO|nr:D-3-phosphoglycerate dehydrogenase [Bimuria novae-zelandiae CBS 107.79]
MSNLSRQVSNSLNLSTSPNLSFHSPPTSFRQPPSFQSSASYSAGVAAIAKQLKPFDTKDVKVLLLENVNQAGVNILKEQGYQVEAIKSSLPEDQLIEKIRDVQVIGIRSKTKLTERVLQEAKNLIVIGCFCIGTNQVDLKYAASQGIAVFNSPFSNSRSVAELVIAEVIALARQLADRSMELHNGVWNKVSKGCWEVRGKTLGIVGYGHIGSQLSVLAEAMGMEVIYYDVVTLMGLGTAKQVHSLDDLLDQSDFVTLHVPETADTKNLIGKEQFEKMKNGSYLINNARGKVVDIPALIEAMRSGKIAGAAIDVFPNEPAGNGDYFNNELNNWTKDLQGLKNLILTPHIGGSTEEAQSAIGVEVSNALVKYVNEGSTLGAVNMPEVQLRNLTLDEPNGVRVVFIHKNVPGVLRQVNGVLLNHNIVKQSSDSRGDIAYLMADVSDVKEEEIRNLFQSLEELPSSLRTRMLY